MSTFTYPLTAAEETALDAVARRMGRDTGDAWLREQVKKLVRIAVDAAPVRTAEDVRRERAAELQRLARQALDDGDLEQARAFGLHLEAAPAPYAAQLLDSPPLSAADQTANAMAGG